LNLEITLLSESLMDGETVRVECPNCRADHERSLSITKFENGEVRYQCFRAKCALAGALNGVPYTATKSAVKRGRKKWEGVTKPLTQEHMNIISKRWSITNPPYWYSTESFGGRVAMSVRAPDFKHRGWVLRSMQSSVAVKALTYLDEGETGLSWYKPEGRRGTVLVEDIPSAVRASKYVNAVALLGTGIGLGKAREIAQYASRPIYVALDQDAQKQGIDHARRFGLLWGDTRVLLLDKDIKDMMEEEICQILN